MITQEEFDFLVALVQTRLILWPGEVIALKAILEKLRPPQPDPPSED